MRKYTFIGILILMAGLGAACEDQLNALPGQSKVEGNVILDQKTAEVALNGVYYRFADGGMPVRIGSADFFMKVCKTREVASS